MQAQDTTAANHDTTSFVSGGWVQLGAGLSSMPGFCQGLGLNIRFLNHILFSVQANDMWAFKTTDSSSFSDVAVMVGYIYPRKNFEFSASCGVSNYTGVSANTGNKARGEWSDYTIYSGPGLALRGQTMYVFSKHFAVGLDLYGSVSSSISRAMLMLNIAYSPFKWYGR